MAAVSNLRRIVSPQMLRTRCCCIPDTVDARRECVCVSRLRRAQNTPINREGKSPKPRQLHYTSWGIVCPVETPVRARTPPHPHTRFVSSGCAGRQPFAHSPCARDAHSGRDIVWTGEEFGNDDARCRVPSPTNPPPHPKLPSPLRLLRVHATTCDTARTQSASVPILARSETCSKTSRATT